MEQMNYASPLFVRSRRAYSTQCMLEYFIALLVSDAFLSKLLTVLGLSDAQVGVISSLISAAFLFQLASVFLVDRIRRVKRCLLFFTTFSQMLFASLYFLPFLNLPAALRQPTVVCLLLLGYFCNYFVTTMVFQWGNSFVSPDLRGEFSAGKEMQSLLGGMIFTLLIGFMVDTLEARGQLMSAFLYIALIGLLTSAGNYICIRRIGGREALLSRPANAPRLREILRNTFGRREFRSLVVLTALYNAALYLSTGFLGTYKLKELALSVGAVQLINIAANLCRFAVSRPMGRYSDRTSFARGALLALCITAAGFALNIFAAPGAWFFAVLYTVLYAVGQAGLSQNMVNMAFNYVPVDYFVHATAIKNSIGGICGFTASLLGGWLLGRIQQNGNSLFGLHVYGQQALSLLSFVLLCAAAIYTRVAIVPQKIMKQ